LPFGYLHLFPFSPRPGTRGFTLHAAQPVPVPVVEARMATLRALAAEKAQAHRRRFIGQELKAITLHTQAALAAQGKTSALTENFLQVQLEGSCAANRLLNVRVAALNAEGELEGAIAA
jgi:threonylcarbamoyladenosine tRNA methylthiotransferase MtaB